MLTVPAPAELNGAQLRQELRAAGVVVASGDMSVVGESLAFPELVESDRATVGPVVQAHTPDPAWTATPQEANARTLRDRAAQALEVNRTYLARTSPTTAQTTAQVKALTQECTALIRLLLGALEATD